METNSPDKKINFTVEKAVLDTKAATQRVDAFLASYKDTSRKNLTSVIRGSKAS